MYRWDRYIPSTSPFQNLVPGCIIVLPPSKEKERHPIQKSNGILQHNDVTIIITTEFLSRDSTITAGSTTEGLPSVPSARAYVPSCIWGSLLVIVWQFTTRTQ